MISEAVNYLDEALAANPETAISSLFGFLTARFKPNGKWDYKRDYEEGTQSRQMAQNFGNFAFGAVLGALGFSYEFAQSAAGTAQIAIGVSAALTGKGIGEFGTGIPFVTPPFGDQVEDAMVVASGHRYSEAQKSGKCP